jgi:ATP/maltotriose-dependent transcriptional regulator MalT
MRNGVTARPFGGPVIGRPAGLDHSGREPAIVGRGGELAQLTAELDRTAKADGTTVVITGEPGIGKTVLLAELARRAEEREFLVLDGRATEFERDDPYAVFTDALDAFLTALPGEARATLPGAELGAVFPALAGTGIGGPADRLRVHSAVRILLGRLAGPRPTVLVIDDLHWADAGSIDLFGYLLRHPPAGRVLVAAALRPAQAPPRLRLALDAGARYRAIPLGPLTRADAASLLPGADEATVTGLFAESGGNPFFLTALARAPRRAAVDARESTIPGPVIDALSAELRALDPAGQRAAWGAAVAGDPFEAALGAAAARLSAEEFLVALDALVAVGLVGPTDVPGRFRFRHPIVRRAVYEAAGPGWRLAAHGRAAAALAGRGAAPLARAHHVERSAAVGDPAAVALLTAAGQAAATRSPAAAAHWFGAALRLLGDTDPASRTELLGPLALAAGSAGRFETSRRATDELLALLPPDQAAARVEIVAFRAFVDHVTGCLDDARALTDRELAALGHDQYAERAALRIELANNALVRCDFDALVEHAEIALRDAERVGRAPLRAQAAAQVAYAHYNLARVDPAHAALRTAVGLVDAMPDEQLSGRLDAALMLTFAECNLERPAAAIAHATRAIEVADATGQVMVTPALYVTRSLARAHRGDVAGSIADSSAAYEVSAFTGSDWTASIARGTSAWVHIWTGDLDTALRHADEAIAIGARVGSALVTANVGLYRAEALLEAGRPDEVTGSLLDAAGGPELPLLERPWRSRAVQLLVRAALARGDRTAARRWIDRGRAELTGIPLHCRQADIRHAEAAVLLADGAASAAVPVSLAAVSAASRGDAPVEAGRARILAGIALAGSGDRRRGLAELRRAERDLERLGARRYRDQAVRELRRLGCRIHRRPATARSGAAQLGAAQPGAQPGELSIREQEIAHLIIAGHSNRQIASQLVISERTVETHVSRILSKLRVRSRAAVGTALHALGDV